MRSKSNKTVPGSPLPSTISINNHQNNMRLQGNAIYHVNFQPVYIQGYYQELVGETLQKVSKRPSRKLETYIKKIKSIFTSTMQTRA
jgi:hypothetical protein